MPIDLVITLPMVAPEAEKLAPKANTVAMEAPNQQVVQAPKDAMAHTSQEVTVTAEVHNNKVKAAQWMAPEEEPATSAVKVATQMPELAAEDQATAPRPATHSR